MFNGFDVFTDQYQGALWTVMANCPHTDMVTSGLLQSLISEERDYGWWTIFLITLT